MSVAPPGRTAAPPLAAWTSATDWPACLLGIGDLTAVALGELLDLAAGMKATPAAWVDALRGEALVCLFERPSAAALVPVEEAAHRLGLLPTMLGPEALDVAAGALGDTVRVLATDAAALVVHTFAESRLRAIARAAPVPTINAASDDQHPLQALADLLTLRERFGALDGLILAYVGPAGSIANSLMEAGALAGMHVRVASPPGQGPGREAEIAAQALADLHGGSVTVTEDPRSAVEGADAVYAGTRGVGWRAPDLARYQVAAPLMNLAKPRAIVMASLPAHRGEEVTAAVIDGPRSVVWQQVANRRPADEAAIYALVSARRAAPRA
ncbi:MAG: ornithine carbamoyltransferase [Solirubrobacterales bacterium]|nr:ornithine carbamoyltransferase [Solirubrobacterales bacterium]